MAAFDFMVALDAALQSCDGRGIVKYITYATPNPHHETNRQAYANDETVNGRDGKPKYNMLALCIDLGSVGFAATWFLAYSMWLNIMVVIGTSHRIWHVTRLAIDESGLWAVVLVTTIACNAHCGPWEGPSWWQELKYSAKDCLASSTPTDPLLNHLFAAIMSDNGL